jgi:DNA-binding NarL/FixJ family response regulator
MTPDVAAELAEHSGEEAFTPKEIDVLRLIAAGNANAAQLSITEEMVKSRVKSILDKPGANDRTHAVTIGVKRGSIEL